MKNSNRISTADHRTLTAGNLH
ncbi:hypothetical protein CCACVL1_05417 [Corchorus capsularis]|uniref:Uncharacterized protein n=1 Tax=Corchorus capsularis TaxID=210143 RepID=A0A1R3JKR3_COCAP|nr:hypothetical protein CCACVL1_05417 [Corchorus capsularis]